MDDPTIGQLTEDPIVEERSGFTRRQVAVAAAWSLPVIAAATAAPMASASVTAPQVDVAIQQAGTSGGGYSGAVTSATFEFQSTIATATNTLTVTLVIAPTTLVSVTQFINPATSQPFTNPFSFDSRSWSVALGANSITMVATNVSVAVGTNIFNLPLPKILGTLVSTGLVTMSYSATLDNPEVFASGAAGYSVTKTP